MMINLLTKLYPAQFVSTSILSLHIFLIDFLVLRKVVELHTTKYVDGNP
jgi:hypothetical protein